MVNLVKYGAVSWLCLITTFLFYLNGLDKKGPRVLKGAIIEYSLQPKLGILNKRVSDRCHMSYTPSSTEAPLSPFLIRDTVELVPTFVT